MYFSRTRLEQHELDTLASYALHSRQSRGRLHHEPEPRYRTAFQRDRDRIVHSAAFRLLEYKTQVFVNDAGDYFRTRLTHTLEVAQIGRTLARALGVNEDLVEAICLAHDLGHPPFGHTGEAVLNQLLADCGGFNHNHQSYRVVTQLEKRYPKWNGLNLTFETLEGIAKHQTDYDIGGLSGIPKDTQPGIEAQIANIADDLAYHAHDLDDGLQAGLIRIEQLAELEIWRQARERIQWNGHYLDDITRHHIIRELVGLQVDDVLHETAENLRKTQLKTAHDVQHHPQALVMHSPAQQKRSSQLKEFLFEHMYRHFRVLRMHARARHFIEALFASYIKEPGQLPEDYRVRLNHEAAHRVIADYIASLTDRSALHEYQMLFNPGTRP